MAARIGQQLGHYRLLRLLGQGTFAEVYLGEHLYLERLAAIKVLHVQMEPKPMSSFVVKLAPSRTCSIPILYRCMILAWTTKRPISSWNTPEQHGLSIVSCACCLNCLLLLYSL
jgi:serine/threonine protein kinase